MSHGMFDSSSSSGDSFVYINSGGKGPKSFTEVMIMLAIFVTLVLICMGIDMCQEKAEQKLDATTYVDTSRANFNRWIEQREIEYIPGSLWFEPGSSHRDNYHCKGGQFERTNGRNVTFCCSVTAEAAIPCMELD